MMLSSEFIADALGDMLRARASGNVPAFRHVVIDSRLAGEGDLFIALPGEQVDGHDFIADAALHGAAGAITERPTPPLRDGFAVFEVKNTLSALQRIAARWRAEHADVHVIGITGSVGKTSCKELTAAVLGSRFHVHKNEANQNNEIGLPLAVLEIGDAHKFAVLEMGMYARGEIAALAAIARPETGVVTNVAPVHLERLGSIDAIAAAKAELVEALPASGLAVLNGDDARVAAMAASTQARVVRFGASDTCEMRGTALQTHGLAGASFRMTAAGQTIDVSTTIPGQPGMQNALAAAAVALEYGMTLEEIAAALATARPFRLAVIAGPRGSVILDDTYNASPPSVLAALDLLSELPGRKIAVLGDMLELGAYEEEGHREVGRRAATAADMLVAVGPRAEMIAQAARETGMTQVWHFASKADVAAFLETLLRPGDYALFKGSRGLALETVIAELTGSHANSGAQA